MTARVMIGHNGEETANGCLGDATQAAQDKGQAMIEVGLERAAEFLEEYVG